MRNEGLLAVCSCSFSELNVVCTGGKRMFPNSPSPAGSSDMNLAWNPVVYSLPGYVFITMFIHYQATNLNAWGIFEPSLHTEASLHCKKYVGVIKLRETQIFSRGRHNSRKFLRTVNSSSMDLVLQPPLPEKKFLLAKLKDFKGSSFSRKNSAMKKHFSSVFFLSLNKLDFNLFSMWNLGYLLKYFEFRNSVIQIFITDFSCTYFLDAYILPVLSNGMQHCHSRFPHQSHLLYVPLVSSLQKIVNSEISSLLVFPVTYHLFREISVLISCTPLTPRTSVEFTLPCTGIFCKIHVFSVELQRCRTFKLI